MRSTKFFYKDAFRAHLNIDYTLLRKQRETLDVLIAERDTDTKSLHLVGLQHLLDAIQDTDINLG